MNTEKTEELISLADVPKFIPRGDGEKPVDRTTVWKWVTSGLKTKNGLVKLESCRIAGRLLTTRAAISKFIDAISVGKRSPSALVDDLIKAAKENNSDLAKEITRQLKGHGIRVALCEAVRHAE